MPPSGTRASSPEAVEDGDRRATIGQAPAGSQRPTAERTDTTDTLQASKDLGKGVKAVAFISKLMGSKRRGEEVTRDDDSISDKGRHEGNDAEIYSQSADGIAYNPKHPQPPAYIKVRSSYRKEKHFDRLFLAQELDSSRGSRPQRQNSSAKLTRRKSSAPSDAKTIWAMEFSRDGKYLAAAGADGIVRVWAVVSSPEDRQKLERQESAGSAASHSSAHLSAPVFHQQPIREYEGHTSTILDLSWSKNNFLLSSSMDKTVRLWHVSRSECLCTFKHNDFVPSIAFHPKDDRYFLTGSLDSKLRLWSIPEKNVSFMVHLPEMITAVAFSPDGKHCIAGCLNGVCMFYETDKMKYQSQVSVRSSRGQNGRGSKITGIKSYVDKRGDTKLLITSNDSRVRLFNFRDKNLELKFRGNENNYSQIRATISDDGRYVVCGSEDKRAYIWPMGPAETEKRDRRSVEVFESHDTITTVVCMAPAQTRILLSRSEDPIYDLCNPPPTSLMNRDDRTTSRAGSIHSSRNGSIRASPADEKGQFDKPREPASYLTRSVHKEGNIIVTADFAGSIKVFRQDCAWSKRKPDDSDRASLFGKRNGRISSTGSVPTRGSQVNLRESRSSTSAPSDRIMSWRQGIASTSNVNDGQQQVSKPASRSASPHRSTDQRPDAALSRSPLSMGSGFGEIVQSPASEKADPHDDNAKAKAPTNGNGSMDSNRSKTHRDSSVTNPLMLQGGQSNIYWNAEAWKARAERAHKEYDKVGQHPELYQDEASVEGKDPNHLSVRPEINRNITNVSQLSDERSSASSEYGDAQEDKSPDMKCGKCGSASFKVTKSNFGSTRLCCTKCGERA